MGRGGLLSREKSMYLGIGRRVSMLCSWDFAGNEGGQTQYLMHVRGRNRCIKDKHMHLNKGLALTGGMQCRAGNLR